jgi:hypothetical protein
MQPEPLVLKVGCTDVPTPSTLMDRARQACRFHGPESSSADTRPRVKSSCVVCDG